MTFDAWFVLALLPVAGFWIVYTAAFGSVHYTKPKLADGLDRWAYLVSGAWIFATLCVFLGFAYTFAGSILLLVLVVWIRQTAWFQRWRTKQKANWEAWRS